jgi:hypothetical protein
MTAETIPDASRTRLKGRYLTPAQTEDVLRDIAVGQLPLDVIAAQHGRSYSHIKRLSYENKERIAEIRAEWNADAGPVPLWIRDKHNRLAIRQGAMVSILEQQAKLKEILEGMEEDEGRGDLIVLEQYKIVREQWVKLEQLKQQILRYVDDAEGSLPTRAPAVVAEGSKMTYTVEGVDVAEVVKRWSQQVAQ